MGIRNCIKIHISVNSGETEEVLIFAPTAGGPFEYLCCQLILPIFKIICQFKFRWGERILTVANKGSVQPQCKSALCSLERNKQPLSLHMFRHCKIFHIACNRIKSLRNLTGINFLMSFPWILDISILRCIISFHLDMCRYMNVIPVITAVVLFLKSLNCTFVITRIMKLP